MNKLKNMIVKNRLEIATTLLATATTVLICAHIKLVQKHCHLINEIEKTIFKEEA